MFKKILIANRGEIALRIIRACREMGIKTVALYSEPDHDSLHVRNADESVCIGPAAPSQSYLNIPRIISAAEITDAEAIHPGYGFLSENPHFAEICESCNIKFIGPTSSVMQLLGDKSRARETMKKAGVPILPGSDSLVKDEKEAMNIARGLGYPVIIKATAGGGGRGIRIAHNSISLANAFITAQREAEAAFGNPGVYIEKYIEQPHHIEVQIMGDLYGNVIHLGERECSIQRRHQKLIEESPSPSVNQDIREDLGKWCVRGAKAVGYTNAGTLEFLMDRRGKCYFMEVNTRIQVEHPVTEAVMGVDIVKEQIRVAAGEKLLLSGKNVHPRGHAIECRINAEDPEKDFLPCPGKIMEYHVPGGPGVRVDSAAYLNYTILPYYDSLVAKLICHGRDRHEALMRMERALDEFSIGGIKTTIGFFRRVMQHELFRQGETTTDFVERYFSS